MIPKYQVVKTAAAAFALVFLGSLLLWLGCGYILINPFVALLGLISCPFFYGMGRLIEKGR